MTEISPQPQTSSNKKSFNWKNILIGVGIGVLLFALAGSGVLVYNTFLSNPTPTPQVTVTPKKSASPSAKPATTSAKPATSSAQTDETANWEVYRNDELKFSLNYPSNWTVGPREVRSADEGVLFKGPGGNLDIAWATEYGGSGCSQGLENIKIKNGTIVMCHVIQTDGSESWSFVKLLDSTAHWTFYGSATAYAPHETNRDVILKIISTLEFD